MRKLKTSIGKKSGGEFAVEQDTLLIHIHGGGFIATTTQSHQSYARVWANNLPNAVIFSIDYRMAPKHKFPDAVDDCWQAYVWIIKNAQRTFGINYKKVVVTGDSAGGSLSITLTLMAINRNFRAPDAIMTSYPSTISCVEAFWPSLLGAVDDPVLAQSYLGLIQRAYCPENDPFIGSRN